MSRVAITEALRFMTDCFKAAGASAKAAQQQAELLIEADRVGHPSHGLNRLEFYINDILSGNCKPNNQPLILKESASTAWVDANNVLGATASHFAMDVAIRKAKTTGVGWVTVKGSNHNGMAGYWAKKAANEGLIGMAFTNTSPLLAPTRSKKGALGTNPISVVAPASDGETFYLDMATTAVAVGKIEMQLRKGEPIPSGWAQDPDGNPTNDAELAFKTGCLMPLGGGEETSGYKGYGLAAMVELFCGISSGANYGHHIRSWSHEGEGGPANLGQCFIAVDPENFAPGFGDRLTESMRYWRGLEPAFKTGCLMPLGGGEETSGYKGYGLAAMVELFCGISSGANYGHHIRSWSHEGEGGPANLGQCFIAVDPENFAPGFGDRLTESMRYWRGLEPAFKTGCLMPLGGGEETSGYKGYGLAAMVELFCGISSGANYGHHIRSWSHEGEGGPANLGQCFIAVDPENFAPGFGDRLTESMRYWRGLEPADNSLPVLAPGDKEKQAAQLTDSLGTVSYVKQQIDSSQALAKMLLVKPMETIN